MPSPSGAIAVYADADLFELCRRGDPGAFRQLFETYKTRVYSFALRFLGDEARAADLTQDIFVKLYSRIDEFRGDARFETWLYRVVANACIDEQRKRQRWIPWAFGDPVSDFRIGRVSAPNVQEQELAGRELSLAVHEAIAKLTPALRVPILLRYMEGLSYDEIGEVLELSPGTVASRLNRAHKMLAKRLEAFREWRP